MTKKTTLIRLVNIMKDTSKAKPLTKIQLSEKMDTGERQVRQAISEARSLGIPIVGTSDARGYYLATNPADIQHLINEYRKRIHTIEGICDSLMFYRDFDVDEIINNYTGGAA